MACSFWRWSKTWKSPFCRQKLFWELYGLGSPLGYEDHGRSVSTHRQTMSTPLASTVLTASWDSHLVSTHRWTMSTPQEYVCFD
ncbi:hypothetical protein Taro_027278, partial [Colocasia esculenta]|nr:hypothetical protein [Colocasia esculenta]